MAEDNPTQSLAAEQAVLGSMMLETPAIAAARRLVQPHDFYYTHHRYAFQAMCDLHGDAQAVDCTTLAAELERRGQLEECGGRQFVAGLLDAIPSASFLPSYARIVVECAQRRALCELARSVEHDVRTGDDLRRVLRLLGEQAQAVAGRLDGRERDWPGSLGDALASADFGDTLWLIEELLCEGCAVMAGASKVGKSWLLLALACAVAGGSNLFGRYQAHRADVLYLHLEESDVLLQERVRALQRRDPGITPAVLRGIRFVGDWPALDETGIGWLRAYCGQFPDTRLVIVDVLAKVRPARRRNAGNAYDEDYAVIGPVQSLARELRIGILLVTHKNKLDPADPFESVTGSMGMTAAPDATYLLRRARGEKEGTLTFGGRRIREQTLALSFEDGLWTCLGSAEQLHISREQAQVLDALRSQPQGMTNAAVAQLTGRTRQGAYQMLQRLVKDGRVIQNDGKYRVSQWYDQAVARSEPDPPADAWVDPDGWVDPDVP